MAAIDIDLVQTALRTLLTEIFEGGSPDGAWILDSGSAGLLGTLDTISAEQASRIPGQGRPSIAAHANHLRFSLDLLNRWAHGEEPFSTADWKSSWSVQTVTDEEWSHLRDQLRKEALAWRDAALTAREIDQIALNGALASVAHAAYHFGALRQVMREGR